MHGFACITVHVGFPVISYFYELAKMRTQKMDSKLHPQETLGHPQPLSTNAGSQLCIVC